MEDCWTFFLKHMVFFSPWRTSSAINILVIIWNKKFRKTIVISKDLVEIKLNFDEKLLLSTKIKNKLKKGLIKDFFFKLTFVNQHLQQIHPPDLGNSAHFLNVKPPFTYLAAVLTIWFCVSGKHHFVTNSEKYLFLFEIFLLSTKHPCNHCNSSRLVLHALHVQKLTFPINGPQLRS